MFIKIVAVIMSLFMGSFYPTCGVVTHVTTDDIVTVRVYSGDEFAFYGDDYEIGDAVAMLMHDNGTDLVFDDMVVAAQYVVIPR